MIEILDGKGVGSGKSYFVCERLIHQFRQGGSAFASDTFRIKWENMKSFVLKRYGLHLEDDQFKSVPTADLFRLHEVTSGGSDDMAVLIVVDEAQQGLNARDWADKSKRALFDWACQSRHDNNDLLFVSQAAANIDKQIRRIATYTWHMRNMEKFPIPGLGKVGTILRIFSFGRKPVLFSRSLLDQDGKTVLEHKYKFADPEIFNCYESKSMRQTHVRFGQPIEKKTLKKEFSKSPMLKIIIPLAVIMLAYGGYRIYKHGLLPKYGSPTVAAVTSDGKANVNAPIVSSSGVGYTIVRDKMVARAGSMMKTTGNGMLRVGEICPLGMVFSIRGNVARVTGPDGKPIYVIGEDWSVPQGQVIVTDLTAPSTSLRGQAATVTVLPMPPQETLTFKRSW